MHEQIVRSGAQTVVSISYIIRQQTNKTEIQERNIEKHEELREVLNNTEINGRKSPIILVPTGILWDEGVHQFGIDAWFADGVHGTPLAQHASGCLFYTFITGKDPRNNSYTELHTNAKFTEKQLTQDQAKWIRNRAWAFYQKKLTSEQGGSGNPDKPDPRP